MLDLRGQCRHDGLRFLAADFDEHDVAGPLLDERGDEAVL